MNPVLVLAVLLVALAGCKPRDSAEAPAAQVNGQSAPAIADSPTSPASADTQSSPVTPAEPVVIAASADTDATLERLTAELESYVATMHFRPKNFQDFVARDRLQVPPPPPGKDYAIVQGRVALVNH